MKKITILLIIIFSTNLFAQNDANYFVNSDGEKIIIHKNIKGKTYTKYKHSFDSDYALTGEFFWYHDKSGNLIKEKQKNINDAYLDGKHYSNLKIASVTGIKRLHEVIAENKEHILTQYYYNGFFYCYLIDKKDGKYIIKKKVVSRNPKKDRKLFDSKMKPYFKNCDLLSDSVYQNTKNAYEVVDTRYPTNNMFSGISNLDCGNN